MTGLLGSFKCTEIAKEIASSLALFIDPDKVSSGCMSTTILLN